MTKPLEFPVPDKIPLIQVQWIDIGGEPGWVDTATIRRWVKKSPFPCVSIGYKVHQDKETLILASTFGEDGWGDLQYYPRSVIRGITQIRMVAKSRTL